MAVSTEVEDLHRLINAMLHDTIQPIESCIYGSVDAMYSRYNGNPDSEAYETVHDAWTRCVDTENYVNRVWNRMDEQDYIVGHSEYSVLVEALTGLRNAVFELYNAKQRISPMDNVKMMAGKTDALNVAIDAAKKALIGYKKVYYTVY